MKKVMRVKHDFDYPDRTVEVGTLLIVESEPAGNGVRHILEGELAFRSVHSVHLEEVDVFAMDEMIKDLRAELQVAKRRAEIAEADDRQAVAAADRLEDNVVQLNRELREARAKEAVKVPVPRAVAEAINFYSSHSVSKPEIYYFGIEGDDGAHSKAIYDWLDCGGSKDTLMEALVNGYTVQLTKEERFTEGVQKLVKRWKGKSEALALEIEELRRSIYDTSG